MVANRSVGIEPMASILLKRITVVSSAGFMSLTLRHLDTVSIDLRQSGLKVKQLSREVRSDRAPAPVGPYSQGVDAGTVYCAGQLGTDPSTGNLEVGISAQTRRAITNLGEVLISAGLDLRNIVKTTVFLASMSEFSAMNEEYAKHFVAPFPARTTVQAAALPMGALVEIDAVAVR